MSVMNMIAVVIMVMVNMRVCSGQEGEERSERSGERACRQCTAAVSQAVRCCLVTLVDLLLSSYWLGIGKSIRRVKLE